MTKEEKQLLLKDLCARFPYGLKICVDGYICTLIDINTEVGDKLNGETFHTFGFNKSNGGYNFCTISEVKPYLRPMSSMTDEEKKQYRKTQDKISVQWDDCGQSIGYIYANTIKTYDWLNKNHFDYRNLIKKSLAIVAPEGMYKTE